MKIRVCWIALGKCGHRGSLPPKSWNVAGMAPTHGFTSRTTRGDGCWDMLSNYWIYWGRIASMYSVHFLLVALRSSPLFFPSILRWFHRSSFTASQPLPAASWSVTGYKQLDSNPRMPCLGRSGKAAGGTFGDFQKFQPLHAALKVLAHVASSTLLLSEFEVWLFDILVVFLCYLCKWLFVASRFFDKLP